MVMPPESAADESRVRLLDASPSPAASLRRQRLVELDGRTLVVTRRHALDASRGGEVAGSDRFVRGVVPALVRAQTDIARAIEQSALPSVPGDRAPRPVRVYAVAEDGTLVSAPWDDVAGGTRAAPLSWRCSAPGPACPTFARGVLLRVRSRVELGVRGDSAERARYSGFYLDLGGRGLVSTLLRPIVVPSAEVKRGAMALDLAFDIDWRAVAASVRPNWI